MRKRLKKIVRSRPGIKARQIAKELSLSRKEVNKCLYENSDIFWQDDHFGWRISSSDKVEILFPSDWITGEAFESCLLQAGPAKIDAADEVIMVLRSGSKPMIESTARVLALANQLRRSAKFVTLDFSEAERTRTYLNRAGFFEHLDDKVQVLPERPKSSVTRFHRGRSDTLFEFEAIVPNTENEGLLEQLVNKFVHLTSNRYEVAAVTVFGELIDNVIEHSQARYTAFAGLQRYGGKRKHIQTVVSDGGLGIARTLRPALRSHYPKLHRKYGEESLEADIGLLSEAMSEGKISRFGTERGLGFQSSSAQAMKFDAKFSVRQEQFCLQFIYEDSRLVKIKKQTNLLKLPSADQELVKCVQ